MPTYAPNTKFPLSITDEEGWGANLNDGCSEWDAIVAIGGMYVSTHEQPSTTLNVDVAPGFWVAGSGVLTTFAGASSQLTTASSTNYVYLNSSGSVVINTSGFPSLPTIYVPLAIVITDLTTVDTITDNRSPYVAIGANLSVGGGTMIDGSTVSVGITSGLTLGGSGQKLNVGDGTLSVLGVTSGWQVGTSTNQILTLDASVILDDGVTMALGSTAGLKIGTATTQRLAFYGKTPIVQSTFGSAVASSSFSTNEQAMLNLVYSAIRNLGLGS